jgi:hypothetical protein
MNTNLQTVREHFIRAELKHDLDETSHVCHAGLGLTNVQARLIVHAPPDEGAVTVLLIVPVLVPADLRATVCEFLMRINHQLRQGCFDLDFDDGEVRFRVALCVGDAPLAEETLRYSITLAATTVDGFFPALMRVLFAGMRPDQAVEQGEGFLRDLLKGDGPDPE